MTRRIVSLSVLGLVVACGSSFAGEDGAGGSAGNVGHAGDAGNAGRGGGAAGKGSASGGDDGNPGTGSAGDDGVVGSGGAGNVGAGGDDAIGEAGRGAGMAGASNGSGGAANLDCASLVSQYFSEVDQARDCDPELESTEYEQCSPDWFFQGPCGCSVPYNSYSENIETIEALLLAIDEQGCELVTCDAPCVVSAEPGNCGGDARHVCQ